MNDLLPPKPKHGSIKCYWKEAILKSYTQFSKHISVILIHKIHKLQPPPQFS